MTYAEVLKNAREKMGQYCKACPVCNGVACKNQIPGPGAKDVYAFIDHSTSFLFLPRGVVIGLAMNNEWGFTGYLYAPPLSEAGSALRSYAAGCTRMGAVFIEYGGETYVVAMFA